MMSYQTQKVSGWSIITTQAELMIYYDQKLDTGEMCS